MANVNPPSPPRRHLQPVGPDYDPLGSLPGHARHTLWCDRIFLADVVRLSGELHAGTAQRAERALLSAVEERRSGPLLVDVAELSCCDSAALHTFVRVNTAARLRGRQMILRRPPPFLRRMIELADLMTVLTIEG